MRNRPVLLPIVAFLALYAVPVQAHQAPSDLAVKVIIVDDLAPKPVLLTDFKITAEYGDHTQQIVRTDENGTIALKLPPGNYTLESSKPTIFKGHSLVWRKPFTVLEGKPLAFTLTDADATESAAPAARQVSDEAKIFQSVKAGVVSVECDFGSGSGFVVDKAGLVLTNQHVINNTHWAAIRFGDGIRVNAQVIEEDTHADVAVLYFNPQALKDITVIRLAPPSQEPLAIEGEKVLAIGSPLHQERILTTGIISKVEPDVLISDVNVNHGNSGGPLLNFDGDAIGITTFLDPGEPNGPGVSGAVSIRKAGPVLERARQKLSSLQLPSPELLPDMATGSMPADGLEHAATQNLKPVTMKAPHHYITEIMTPYDAASIFAAYDREMEKSKKHRKSKVQEQQQPLGPRRYWERYAWSLPDPVVYVRVKPALMETSGSMWAGLLGAAVGVRTQAKLEFRDDFYDLQFYRGDKLIEPVRRNRVPFDALYEDLNLQVKDRAYGGAYLYDPSAFEPGEPLTLKVRSESNLDKWATVAISSKDQEKIWNAFAGYRQSLVPAIGETGGNK